MFIYLNIENRQITKANLHVLFFRNVLMPQFMQIDLRLLQMQQKTEHLVIQIDYFRMKQNMQRPIDLEVDLQFIQRIQPDFRVDQAQLEPKVRFIVFTVDFPRRFVENVIQNVYFHARLQAFHVIFSLYDELVEQFASPQHEIISNQVYVVD